MKYRSQPAGALLQTPYLCSGTKYLWVNQPNKDINLVNISNLVVTDTFLPFLSPKKKGLNSKLSKPFTVNNFAVNMEFLKIQGKYGIFQSPIIS